MSILRHTVVGLLSCLLLASALAAETVALNPSHPDRYTVEKGDTLWDISGRFLRDPWRWPDVWQANPQIANPHWIYPGDVIVLSYVDGQPRLSLEGSSRDVKLSPSVRRTQLDGAIPAIPIDAIRQFLSRQYVATGQQIQSAPYIAAFEEGHLAAASGDQIYVRAIASDEHQAYDVVRPGKPYIDPETGEKLGYEAMFIGNAELRDPGDPATLVLLRTEKEAVLGDRLLPDTEETPLHAFHPKAPSQPVQGRIISVLEGVSQIGQYQTVVLDRGAANGLEPGDVLKVYQGGYPVRDWVRGSNQTFRLPLEEAGVMMVYRVFPRISFGLIMYATKPLHIYDLVRSPET